MRSAARGSAPCARPKSPSTTPTSARPRKVVALGDDLRADDDVELAGLDAADHLAHFGQAGNEIGRQQRDAGVGKALRDLLLHALDAGTAGDERARRLAHFGHFSGSESEKPQ